MDNYNGMQRSGIRTLFGDMVNRRTSGTIMMLVVFIVSCLSLVINILALAMRESGRVTGAGVAAGVWVCLLLFQLAVIMLSVFRLDLINVIVGSVGIEGLCTILFYALMLIYFDCIDGPKPLAASFMSLLILGVCAKVVFVCLNSFMKQDFSFVTWIISISYSVAAVLFCIIVFIVAVASGKEVYRDEMHELLFGYYGAGFGFVTYLLAVLCVGAISFCLYRGELGTKIKFAFSDGSAGAPYPDSYRGQASQAVNTGASLQCIAGVDQGQTYMLQGEVILGSDRGSVSIFVAGERVSRQHCRIYFDAAQGFYYVMDVSTNGTYVNGQRIQAGAYTACGRGSVVALADQGQQYRLL